MKLKDSITDARENINRLNINKSTKSNLDSIFENYNDNKYKNYKINPAVSYPHINNNGEIRNQNSDLMNILKIKKDYKDNHKSPYYFYKNNAVLKSYKDN